MRREQVVRIGLSVSAMVLLAYLLASAITDPTQITDPTNITGRTDRVFPIGVTLTLPNLVDETYHDGSVEWTATCDDNKPGQVVQLVADGFPVGAVDSEAPFGGTWVSGLSVDATQSLVARCTDAAGNTTSSAAQVVTLDVTAPVVSNLSAVTATATEMLLSYTLTEGASGVDESTVTILRCDASPCTPTTWEVTAVNPYLISGLGASTVYDWQVQACDNVGNCAALPTKVTSSLADLVAYYPLDGNGDDLSVPNKDCTVNGDPTFVAGRHSDGMYLDGVGDYCMGSHDAAYNSVSSVTVQALIDCNGVCGASDVAVARSAGSTSRAFEMRIGSVSTQGTFVIYDDTNTARTTSTTNVFNSGTPQLLTGTFGGGEIRLYQNATHRSTLAFGGSMGSPTQGISIGARSNVGEPFTGFLNEVRVWSRRLSTPDVQAMYRYLTPQPVTSVVLGEKAFAYQGYPKYMQFRREGASLSSYATYKREFFDRPGPIGTIQKTLNEEVANVQSATQTSFMAQADAEFPEKSAIIHFNGRGRDPTWRMGAYSPMHFIWLPGSVIDEDVGTGDTTIPVDSTAKFKVGIGSTGVETDDLLIVRLDGSGDPIWSEFEYAKLVSIGSGEITVARGQLGTTPIAFTANLAYVAPAVNEGPWGIGSRLMWAYNFGGFEDSNGDTADELLAAEVAAMFGENGELEEFTGIEFDIAPWSLVGRLIQGRVPDFDFDGTADAGIIGGVDLYAQGVRRFYQLLREGMGPDRLIMADGGDEESQRVIDYLNGIESEGFDNPARVYEDWTKAINFHTYWQTHSLYLPRHSYISHRDKEPNAGDIEDKERMVLGAATCLGLGVSSLIVTPAEPGSGDSRGIPDEIVKGTALSTGWLGQRVGSVIYPWMSGTDILVGQTMTPSVTNGTVETIGTMYSLSDPVAADMVLSFAGIVIPEGDVIITFDARSFEYLPGQARSNPRHVTVKLDGKQASTQTMDEVFGYAGLNAHTPLVYYFREAGAPGGSTVTLEIHIEGGGRADLDPFFQVKNIKAFSSQFSMACEFDNGAILVNPSLDDYNFDLSALFPGDSFKRIQARSLQDTAYNDGSAVSGVVTVPMLNGLFLDRVP